MKELNFDKCQVRSYVTLDSEGRLDDTQTGQFGFRVFYDVPRDEIVRTGLFKSLDDDVIGGQLEFTLDGEGNPTGETLLWLTVENMMKKVGDKSYFENSDFENYDGDITPFITDFFNHLLRW